MKLDARGVSRRGFVRCAAMLLGGLTVGGVPITAAAAEAGKLAKAAVKYQVTPNGGKDCDDCLQFVPGKTATVDGTCKVVDGAISPRGYCIAFVAKPKG